MKRPRKTQNPVPTSKFCLLATTVAPEPVNVVIDVLTLDEELDVLEAVTASVCVEVERVDKVEANIAGELLEPGELVPPLAITDGDKFWGAFLASAAKVSIVRDLFAAGLMLRD